MKFASPRLSSPEKIGFKVMNNRIHRREALRLTGGALFAGAVAPQILLSAEKESSKHGAITGEPMAAKVGEQVLADGGNAVDAIVSAALTAAVVSVHNCGIGGYGGSAVIALAGGKKVTALDFNTAAPAAAREDMFPLDEKGQVKGRVHEFGWLASGVPGTIAGLELAVKRYGTRSFRDALQPAIKLIRDGFAVPQAFAASAKSMAARLKADAGTAKLFLKDGEPFKLGETWRNPDLAAMLETLAQRNSAESFYRGDIAQRIAEAFHRNGGLVTAKDMAAYQAREVEPDAFAWRGFDLRTAPLTAGGLTVLEALSFLKALDWDKLPAGPEKSHARLEALRVAWEDRLKLFGDPDKVKVPVSRLLSADYAKSVAEKVRTTVKDRKPLAIQTESRVHVGTINLSCVDRHGNLAALTLTHGNAFGTCVAVDGLGLVLGHGMSRFEPKPGHPNSPGPGKRPLHNMCPTVVLRDGRPILAVGGAGGRRIPNSIFDVLTQFVALGATMDQAVAAPRLHCDGNLELTLEKSWPAEEQEYFKSIGYKLPAGAAAARVGAASFDPKTGECRAALR
jgi:gamma-glutamyltranspeptidase/glutathione hydrolase